MFCDDMLVSDPATGRVDLAFNGTGLVMDTSPQTALLIAIGSDRRARPDDVLPDPVMHAYAPATLNARRGTPLDALDALGRLFGCRLWLLIRAKQNEATRRAAEGYLKEATAPIAALGLPVTITVRWLRQNMLGWQVAAGSVTMSNSQAVG